MLDSIERQKIIHQKIESYRRALFQISNKEMVYTRPPSTLVYIVFSKPLSVSASECWIIRVGPSKAIPSAKGVVTPRRHNQFLCFLVRYQGLKEKRQGVPLKRRSPWWVDVAIIFGNDEKPLALQNCNNARISHRHAHENLNLYTSEGCAKWIKSFSSFK